MRQITLSQTQDLLTEYSQPQARMSLRGQGIAAYRSLLRVLHEACQRYAIDVPSWLNEALAQMEPLPSGDKSV